MESRTDYIDAYRKLPAQLREKVRDFQLSN